MASWKNATRPAAVREPPEASTKGVLRPAETVATANLRRDHPVSAALRPFVERYWTVRWDRNGMTPFRTEVLSHPSVNVSVEQGSHPRFGVTLPAVLVHGVVTRRFSIDLVGSGRVTAVKFRPGGFSALTGSAPARDSVTYLGDDLGVAPGALAAVVLAEEDDDTRAAALDAALEPLAADPAPAYLDLLGLLEQMACDRGLTRVDDLAARASTTVRSVQRLFATYVGVGPKAVLARYRLQDAVDSIDRGEAADLAALAASLGWFDQAHFSRDFHDVVGTTPSAYAQRARVVTGPSVTGPSVTGPSA